MMTDPVKRELSLSATHMQPAEDVRHPPLPLGARSPVFLHSSFRTGSTWLWAKLRSAPTTVAYYEFFHEGLAGLTRQGVRDIDNSKWESHHPVAAAYFLEYIPLLAEEGGIAGFDRRAAFAGFIPRGGMDGDLAPAEKSYVDHLIAHAAAKQRIPVLTCTRSLGRARALRRGVGGKVILLHRNLFHQWASYSSQRENGNPYFMEMIRHSFAAAADDPFLNSIAQWYGLNDPRLPEEALFQAFLLLHLYLYAIAYDAADVVVNLTEISIDRRQRQLAEQQISDLVFHQIDLSDAHETCEFPDLIVENPLMMRDTIEQFAKLIPSTSLSPDGLAFVHRAKDEALAEWSRFEFFSRRMRTALMKKVAVAELTSAELKARQEAAEAQAELLRLDLSEACKRHADQRAAHDDALRLMTIANDDVQGRLAMLLAEHQSQHGSLETLQAALTAAEAELGRSQARSAELMGDLETARVVAAAEKAAGEERIAQVEAESQSLRVDLLAAAAERDSQRGTAEALQEENRSQLALLEMLKDAQATSELAAQVADQRASRAETELGQSQARIGELMGDLEKARVAAATEKTADEERFARAEADSQSLRTDLQAVAAERDVLRETAEALREEHRSQLSVVETLREDAAAASRDAQAADHRAEHAEADLKRLQAHSDELLVMQRGVTAERDALAERLARAETEMHELRNDLRAALLDGEASRSSSVAVQTELADAMSARADLERSLAEARDQLETPMRRMARWRRLRI